MDTMVAILEREPPPLCAVANGCYPVSHRLERIGEKTLRKESSERYQTAAELLVDLQTVRRQINDAPRLTGTSQTAAKLSRHRYLFYLGSLMVLLLAALGWTFFYRISLSRPQANVTGAQPGVATTGKLYAQMSEAEQLSFIDEQEQRISNMMGDRPAKLNEEAARSIKRYVDAYAARLHSTSTRPGAENLSVVYARARPYVPLIARSFEARRVPVIVGIYLPLIESEYKNCFENKIGAKGLFQFLPEVAENYGVSRQDMCDAEKMTPAAAHYIADRMAELGEDSESVTLVVLSYNRGAESVRTILRELRSRDNYERNFWTLFANRDKLGSTFREQDAGYVPNFFAAAIIGENPQTFELSIPALSTLSGASGSSLK